MAKRMLIDATHAEETRVVVTDGTRLDEFDVETSTKKQLKGNIYLAKVVRVEPSLQAAFVEYGGNRHGFLAFGEIHPDYYQIPVADRQRLLEMQAEEAREAEEEEEAEARAAEARATRRGAAAEPAEPEPADDAPSGTDEGEGWTADAPDEAPPAAAATPPDAPPSDATAPDATAPEATPPEAGDASPATDAGPDAPRGQAQPLAIPVEIVHGPAPEGAAPPADAQAADAQAAEAQAEGGEDGGHDAGHDAGPGPMAPDIVEVLSEPAPLPEAINAGEADAAEDDSGPRRIPQKFLRNYKIQEVIKRRQILLVQVVKEERGNKGAALTTYMSLAGRYCVLMPNSPRGGGISRKITSAADRKRLREVTTELAIPDGMGLIVRTAGAQRPKTEIKRDCEYLLRLWDSIRETTLASTAPALIYEEASLIKRSIRDVYTRDVDEILVEGEDAYRQAKDFMRMLMPSHARKVQPYRDPAVPLFAQARIEAQLDAMHSPTVQLKSGGYVVINQTEALVAIDVNSGRSTRERGIEETALRTNLEAADEIARQLRLRDLAGLIVIDFIDMESAKHNAAVERRLKDALRHDRARIQLGRISHFGLMEMSRQRLRPSLTEQAFVTCPHCAGIGLVRTTESAAMQVLRAIEEEAGKRRAAEIVVTCAATLAIYLLNHKRARLAHIEAQTGMRTLFAADDSLNPPAHRIERTKAALPPESLPAPAPMPLPPPEPDEPEIEEEADFVAEEDEAEAPRAAPREGRREAGRDGNREGARERAEAAEGEDGRRRRRRRRRRGGRREDGETGTSAAEGAEGEFEGDEEPSAGDASPAAVSAEAPLAAEAEASDGAAAAAPEGEPGETAEEAEARRRRRGRRGGRRRRRDGAPGEDGQREDGSREDGSREDGSRIDGSRVDGSRVDGSRVDGAGDGEAAGAAPADAPRDSPPAPVPSAHPASTRAAAPRWAGPTPADPFGGGAGFDVFAAMEAAEEAAAAEAAARVARRAAAPPPEAAPTTVAPAAQADEPPAAQAEEPPTAQAEEPPVAAEEPPAPADEPPAAPAIQPILVDQVPADAPRRRGWWKRT